MFCDQYGYIRMTWHLVFWALVTAAVVIPLGIWMSNDQARWESWCNNQGGIITDSTGLGSTVTVSGSGQVGVGTTSTTTYYCIVDGKLVDTY